ncbi:MAG TPA: sigma-70 family RNA polymerase sigma factor [Gemmatimonadota bacterium]|nr:sigma-70 family RNA polymerase sigma factor [Gemmatimonadota bacterium]
MQEECVSHLDALFGAALRMTGDRQDAEDLVQDTYVKAIRNLHRYREGGSCKAWLFRILTNAYIDRYRKARRSPIPVELDEEGRTGLYDRLLDAPGEDAAPALELADLNDFLDRFVGDEVKRSVEGLPEIFRTVIVLRDMEGFSYQEIADILEIPIGTVMSRLFRGRRLLQESLRDYAVRQGYVRTREAS